MHYPMKCGKISMRMAEENRDTTEIRIDKAINEIEEIFDKKEKEEEDMPVFGMDMVDDSNLPF